MISKEEFERGYCQRGHMTREEYQEERVTLPCYCDYEKCEGWAAVPNIPDIIQDHMKFYGQPKKSLEE
jgi:hypothetical protein